jgi:5-methyltetrahydrofolate--homocysteine methyltransferase
VDILRTLSTSLEKGDAAGVAQFTRNAVSGGLDTLVILNDGLIAGMKVVGEKFKTHQIYLPDVLMAAKAMYAGMDVLKPLLLKENIPAMGKVVIGTVQGDMHDIGKNLVAILLRGAGFELIDLGKDVPPERFVQAAEENHAGVIGMSALLTTTMPVMKKVIRLAKERGIYGKTKIIVGGASLSREYAAEIGADAYCYDGVSAVDCVRGFLSPK